MFKESSANARTGMKRARVIAEINSFEQARRVEETVKTGYAETTQEEIVQWMAVEEDLISSYRDLEAKGGDKEQRTLAGKLRSESETNLRLLGEVLEKLKFLDAQRARRVAETSKLLGSRET